MFQLILVLALFGGLFLALGYLVFRNVGPVADRSKRASKSSTKIRYWLR